MHHLLVRAINHLLVRCQSGTSFSLQMSSHMVWMTMKVTQSHASSVGASDQSSAGAISIRGLVLTPNVFTYGLDDDEGYPITCIICWCERSIVCWCDLHQGPRSHSKCLSARISERFLTSLSALQSWRQEKYNNGMKGPAFATEG